MSSVIRWFTYNDVAANLLMMLTILWGCYGLSKIPMESLPQYESDIVNIRVASPGATPREMEREVVMRIEEAIYGLEGIKEIVSTAVEAIATIDVEIARGYDARVVMSDIKVRVDGIQNFPETIESPDIRIAQRNFDVISVVVAAEMDERDLRRIGEKVRDDILALHGISQVELTGVRAYEISVEVSERELKRYGLTFEEISRAINRSSLNVSAGTVKGAGGDILLSSKGQAYTAQDFEDIVIRTGSQGIRLTLGDIASVIDGFTEGNLSSVYQGKPAVMIDITRVGDENAIDIADQVKGYIDEASQRFPPEIQVSYWRDRSKIIKSRINTLLKSALQGGILVLLVLAVFLRLSVALWVCLGIPVSFLGVLAIMPLMDVTINTTTTFAFIMVLGIVVDDAIVTGESIYRQLEQCIGDRVEATISGVNEVAVPVTFGVLTTIASFSAMLNIDGRRGQMFAYVALIVIPALLFSLVETKLVLPAHLKHCRPGDRSSAIRWLEKLQDMCSDKLHHFVRTNYRTFVRQAVEQRYLTASLFLGGSLLIFSLVVSGYIGYTFFPRVESEVARATLVMPVGTSYELTERYTHQIETASQTLQQRYVNKESGKSIIRAVYSITGRPDRKGNPQSNQGIVMLEIEPPESRGSPVDIQLQSTNLGQLESFAVNLRQYLLETSGVFDINDNFEDGKNELRLVIKPQAEFLGLTLSDLAGQVRQAFYGLEVQRVQRDREELRVMLRYPLSERHSLNNLETMYIRTMEGTEVPFADVAELMPIRGVAVMRRIDRERTFNVIADINKAEGNIVAIKNGVNEFMQQRAASYPDVRYAFAGEAKEQEESFASLISGVLLMLVVIYALLAIPFRSYLQPFIVMSVIPFGLVGAILGHLVMGMNLTIISILGMLALAGVVVNDSLILIDRFNVLRKQGQLATEAVINAGCNRFRAILLTSLTTFAGLAPLLLERATQAQFLIPMAISLGFGILFSTLVTLVLVPAFCIILEDCRSLTRKLAWA